MTKPPEPPYGPARHTDPDTSKTAADKKTVTVLEKLFLQALRSHPPGLTTTEIARYHHMERDSFSPRPPALLRKGLIEYAGKRFCPNAAGKFRWMIAFKLKGMGTPDDFDLFTSQSEQP